MFGVQRCRNELIHSAVGQMECTVIPHEWSASLFSEVLKTSLGISNDLSVSNMIPFTSQDKSTFQKLPGLPCAKEYWFFGFCFFLNTNYLPEALEMSSAAGNTSC